MFTNWKKTAAAAFAAAAVSTAQRADALMEVSFMTATTVGKGPKIDGSIDDACWGKAQANDTCFEYWTQTPSRVPLKTECHIVYDDRGIYTGVRNYESQVGKLRHDITRNDIPSPGRTTAPNSTTTPRRTWSVTANSSSVATAAAPPPGAWTARTRTA
ncbi:MAG: hypothetical protein J6T01_05825 [Kiritimatiellae bacterium]|nr:hypothetical protein [Kiritimatiellia bacterium]